MWNLNGFPLPKGFGLSLLSTLLFVLPPLLEIQQIKPIVIFRRDMEGVPKPWKEWWREQRASLAAGLLICLGLAGMASFLIDANWAIAGRVGGWFVGGLIGALALLPVFRGAC